MAFAPLRRTRLNQPNGDGVDPQFCSTGNIIIAGKSVFSAGRAIAPALVETVDYKPTKGGLAGAAHNGSAGIYVPGAIPFAKLGSLIYVAQVVWNGDTSVVIRLGGFGNNGAPHYYVEEIITTNYDQYGNASAGNFRTTFRDQSGGRFDFAPTTYRLTANVLTTIVIALDSGSTARMWVNGAQVAVSYGSTGFSPSASGVMTKEFALYNFNYGSSTTGHGDAFTSDIAAQFRCSLFARLVAPVKMAGAIAANPWQVFL